MSSAATDLRLQVPTHQRWIARLSDTQRVLSSFAVAVSYSQVAVFSIGLEPSIPAANILDAGWGDSFGSSRLTFLEDRE
jgi:hypothetical protein